MMGQPLRQDMLPRKRDIIAHVIYLKESGHDIKKCYRETANLVHNIWESADCPPITVKPIITKVENLINEYKKPKEIGEARKGKHQRLKDKPSVAPSRRSLRQGSIVLGENETTYPQNEENITNHAVSVHTDKDISTTVKTRHQIIENIAAAPDLARMNWLENEGMQLFDVLAKDVGKPVKVEEKEKQSRTFDASFYEDQKGKRTRKIDRKLNEDFVAAQKKSKEVVERKRRRVDSAYGYGNNLVSSSCFIDDVSIDVQDLDSHPDPDLSAKSFSVSESAERRKTRNMKESVCLAKISQSTQTDLSPVFPKVPIRVKSARHRKDRLIDPKILEAIVECETVARCSMDTAIKVIQIAGNRIFGQTWLLPLSMDHKYLRDLKKLKTLQRFHVHEAEAEEKNQGDEKLRDTPEEHEGEDEIRDEKSDEDEDEDEEVNFQVSCLEAEDLLVEEEERNKLISKLKKDIEKHRSKLDIRLPSAKAIRKARFLISYEAERLVAEEMVAGQGALMPDGTGRKLIGKVGGVVVQTKGKGKTRTLPFQKMGNEKRENWGDLIIYLLKRMSILTGKEKTDFWHSILLFISDQCGVNKGISELIAQKLGVTYRPGQVYCNIHPVLMFDEKLKQVWETIEKHIGNAKLFPSLSHTNLDLETLVVSIQCLDALMGLVSPDKSNMSWNRFFDFNRYLDPRLNYAFSLKDRRFGKLPALCLVALHHFNDVINYLDSVPDCRNQLACLCRSTVDLEDYLKFIWCAASLLGLHLYEPYLLLIIDLNTPQSKLLDIFPQFYHEMLNPQKSFAQIREPALESLAKGWQSPYCPNSPYKSDVIKSLETYLETVDKDLMETHIASILREFASGFANQKGEAYGFGPDAKDAPTILKEAPSLEVLDRFSTHSKAIENKFGHLDNLLNHFTPSGFEKACQSMVISGAKDLVFDGSHSWKNITKEKVNEMKVEEVKWTDQQQKLRDAGCTNADVIALERQSKMTTLIQKLKDHGGPLNSVEEIDQFLENEKKMKVSEKQLAKTLNDEIRFRRDANLRYALTKNCYLYKQRNITNTERVNNLKVLVQRPEGRSTATLDDLRDVYARTSGGTEDLNDREDENPQNVHKRSKGSKDSLSQPSEDRPSDQVVNQSKECGQGKERCEVVNQKVNESEESTQKASESERVQMLSEDISNFVLHGPWPPQVYEHLAVKTKETWGLGEVVEIHGDEVLIRLFKKINVDGYEEYSLWQDDNDERVVDRSSVLPIRPASEIVPSLCLFSRYRRRIVVQVGNPELIDSLCTI